MQRNSLIPTHSIDFSSRPFAPDSASKVPSDATGVSVEMFHTLINPFAYPAIVLSSKIDAAYRIPPGIK